MRFVYLIGAFLGGLMVAGSVWGVDFTAADDLYAQRENNPLKVRQAREAYRSLLPGLTGSDLLYAVTQMNRTYFYEGEALTPKVGAGRDRRRALFGECWKTTNELIAPSKLGYEAIEYYYWRASCLALYAEVSSTVENLRNISLLRKSFTKGKELDISYEGGGLYRAEAGVIANPKAKPIPGLYNPNEALKLVNAALEQAPYPGTSNGGSSFCENYRRKALTLRELGRVAEAKELLESSLDEFKMLDELEMLPEGLEPETRFCMRVLEELLN